jgi:hypothetical protein
MVEVGIVRMPVPQRLVPMPVRMRFDHSTVVAVLMMFVVHVPVLMLQRLMYVSVAVPLGEVEPEAERHESTRDPEQRGNWLPQQGHGQDCAYEGRQRKIGSRPRCAQMPQTKHEHDETDADPEKPHHRSSADQRDRGDGRAHRQCQHQVGCARDQALQHRDLHRVGR